MSNDSITNIIQPSHNVFSVVAFYNIPGEHFMKLLRLELSAEGGGQEEEEEEEWKQEVLVRSW